MSIPAWARVGAKVVCISDNLGWLGRPSFALSLKRLFCGDPRKGRVYSIARVEVDNGICWLWVKGFGVPYTSRCFRPAVSLKDDISAHFQQFLSNTEREEA